MSTTKISLLAIFDYSTTHGRGVDVQRTSIAKITTAVFTFLCKNYSIQYQTIVRVDSALENNRSTQIKCSRLYNEKSLIMSATNIFYRIPSQRGTRLATIAGPECTLDQFCDYIIDSEGFNRNDFIIASGTKVFRPSSCSLQSISLRNNSHIDILIPLLGGKGGFGSLLRAIGAQIEKTTNRDACRDLSGRRLRDVKREDELKKLIALQEKLQEERKRRKKEKLEKLKKKTEVSSTNTSIQELVAMFDDHEFNRRRLELCDIIEAAVDKGIINFKKRQQDQEDTEEVNKKLKSGGLAGEVDSNNPSEKRNFPNIVEDSECSETVRREIEDNNMSVKMSKAKKSDLWLGLEDGSDGEEEEDHVQLPK